MTRTGPFGPGGGPGAVLVPEVMRRAFLEERPDWPDLAQAIAATAGCLNFRSVEMRKNRSVTSASDWRLSGCLVCATNSHAAALTKA